MNTIGTGKPWKFSHFRKTDGYANMPLDGVWLRAPYLHNGSVPTLRALLFPDERPRDVLPRLRRVRLADGGLRLRRRRCRDGTACASTPALRGNGNGGHLYGRELPPADREALIEFLKTL